MLMGRLIISSLRKNRKVGIGSCAFLLEIVGLRRVQSKYSIHDGHRDE